MPETPERQRQELEFWSALGAALRFVKGQATPEMGYAFTRARELWEQIGSPSEFLHIPYGQSFYHMYRGEFDVAQRLDEDLLRLSHQHNNTAGLVLGHASAGRTLMYLGRFGAARSHLEEVLALYDPISHAALLQQSASHPRLSAMGQSGIALFCLGFPDQALAHSNAAIAEAVTLAHAPSLAASLAMGARLLALGGDHAALDQCAGQLIAVAGSQGFPLYQALGTIYRGWGKVMSGDVAEGMALLRSGSSAYGATGADTRISFHIALLAKACEIAGQVEEALSLVGDALQIVERIGERWFAAELYRHKGQLLLRQGDLGPPISSIAKPWGSPGSRRPSSGNCAPPPASLGSFATRGAAAKPMTFSPRSMAGLPRVSTRETSGTPRHCSTRLARIRTAQAVRSAQGIVATLPSPRHCTGRQRNHRLNKRLR